MVEEVGGKGATDHRLFHAMQSAYAYNPIIKTTITAAAAAQETTALLEKAIALAALLGVFPVALPPKYQLPISVSFPEDVSIATLAPTLESSERKDPK
ncbi:MAG: hypothetical protein M1834_003795 [Cirrosporium novae-zelandiae]|nr:MAG: hypothetical protein M1834_003795 [Cirrosporium novae-zelandiae]